MANNLSKKILFIRLQAIGDSIITYPYIREFSHKNPEFEIHFLTRKYASDIPKHLDFIKKTWVLQGNKRPIHRLPYTLLLLPQLFAQNFDAICDLQNNRESRLIRQSLLPKKYSSFDNHSPIPAGDRVSNAVKNLGLNHSKPNFKPFSCSINPKYEFDKDSINIVINPAGYFSSRNWPSEYYFEWARELLKKNNKVQFVILGVDRVASFAKEFTSRFPEHTTNLVNKTSLYEAFSIIQKMDLMLTEDSGLMHMAWVSGIKTLAIFGSTRSEWSRPLGEHSFLLDSSDLECGPCLLPICKYGDTRCLTRYSPNFILEKTLDLISK